MNDETAQTIFDTTPEEVYRVLSGYDRDLFVDPGNPTNCPLHHYFCDALLMEPDDVHVDMESVTLGYRGEGEFTYAIPDWMTDYQEVITMGANITIGKCLDVLATMYPQVKAVEEGEDEPEEEIGSVEECIAQLKATHGTDRDPVASAVYHLELYAASLAYAKERNG